MIKVTIGESKTQEVKEFPKLMELEGVGGVFIFSDNETCMCIDNTNVESSWNIGEIYYKAFYKSYTPIHSPITIQNQ